MLYIGSQVDYALGSAGEGRSMRKGRSLNYPFLEAQPLPQFTEHSTLPQPTTTITKQQDGMVTNKF